MVLLSAMDGVYDPFTPLTPAQKDNFIYKGYNITIGSKKEELILENFLYLAGSRLQYYVEEETREAGLQVHAFRIPSTSQVVVDRELLTGANPSSIYQLTNKFVNALTAR